MMGRSFWLVVFTLLSGQFVALGPTNNPDASFRYVTPHGAGAKDGTDWINACDGFTGNCVSASMVRGNTYYVADGTYVSHGITTFSKAESGTTRIVVKKATVSDHGTATGFINSMGEGQAIFDTIQFGSSYWTMDGQTGSGASGFGFKVAPSLCSGSSAIGINVSQSDAHESMHISRVEIQGCGEDRLADGTIGVGLCSPSGGCGMSSDGVYACAISAVSDLQLQYLYIHDWTRNGITLCQTNNSVIEYVRIERTHSADGDIHGQAIQVTAAPMTNITFRYNFFVNCDGTAAIAWLGGAGTYSNMYVYGNVFYGTDTARYSYSPSAIYGRDSNTQTTFLIYNNTFYNILRPEAEMDGTATGIELRNNLYVNSQFLNNPSTSGVTSSHNFYYNNTGAFVPVGETGQQDGTSDPFVSAPLNLQLSVHTTTGFTLSSPYDTDPLGVTRGAGGTWDRGAYQKTP